MFIFFFPTCYLLEPIWWGSVVLLSLFCTAWSGSQPDDELHRGPSSSSYNYFFLTCRSTPTPFWCTAVPFVLLCAHKYTPTCHYAPPLTSSRRLPLGIVGAALTVVGAISSTAQPRLWVKLLTTTFCFLCSACCRNGVNTAATRATC